MDRDDLRGLTFPWFIYLFFSPFLWFSPPSFVPQVKTDSVVSCVLDAEAVAWDREKKQIQPFQVLTTRKRKVGGDVEPNVMRWGVKKKKKKSTCSCLLLWQSHRQIDKSEREKSKAVGVKVWDGKCQPCQIVFFFFFDQTEGLFLPHCWHWAKSVSVFVPTRWQRRKWGRNKKKKCKIEKRSCDEKVMKVFLLICFLGNCCKEFGSSCF